MQPCTSKQLACTMLHDKHNACVMQHLQDTYCIALTMPQFQCNACLRPHTKADVMLQLQTAQCMQWSCDASTSTSQQNDVRLCCSHHHYNQGQYEQHEYSCMLCHHHKHRYKLDRRHCVHHHPSPMLATMHPHTPLPLSAALPSL